MHVYVVITNSPEALSKGRSDYDQPQDNVSHRFSLDNSMVLIEGMFTEDEITWFEQNGTIIGSADETIAYIQANKAEWEAASVE